jgi:hypothetical protein
LTYRSSRSKLSFQNCSKPPTHSWIGRRPRASRRRARYLPSDDMADLLEHRCTRTPGDCRGGVSPARFLDDRRRIGRARP